MGSGKSYALTLKNLEAHVQADARLSPVQRRKAETRLSFARRWLCDERRYEWSDVLAGGRSRTRK